LHLHGAPVFAIGEKVLLFLVKHKGLYFVQHFALGAFHEVNGDDTTYAARAIDDRTENGMVRNVTLFKEYIRRILGDVTGKLTKSYFVKPTNQEGFRTLKSRYNLFFYGNYSIRWFDFDEGKTVTFATYSEQPGINGGENEKF
jgi:hypothetical protein